MGGRGGPRGLENLVNLSYSVALSRLHDTMSPGCPGGSLGFPCPRGFPPGGNTPGDKPENVRLPDCKPVPVPLRAAVIHLHRPLLTGSSDLPGSLAGRAVPPPLFGLAPRGVFPAGGITPAAVRSYRTISPLPPVSGRRYIFCGTFRRASRPSRPLAGTPPCGDRTFLSRCRKRLSVRQPHSIIVAFWRPKHGSKGGYN